MGKNKQKSKQKLVSWTSLTSVNVKPNTSETRRMTYVSSVVLTAATFNTQSFTCASVRSTCTEWASYSPRWSEYRILAMKVHVSSIPTTPASSTTVMCATDRSGVGPNTLATPAAFLASTNVKIFEADHTDKKLITYEARAIDLEDQDFTPVNTNSTAFSIYVALHAGAAVSTGTLIYFEAMVQFRGPN